MRHFADKLRTIFEPAGVTVIGLAHENRTGNLRGSLDWRNAADRVLELTKADDGTRELRNGEVRDGPEDVELARFRFVGSMDAMVRRHLDLELVAPGAAARPRTKAADVRDRILVLLAEEPTLSRAKVAGLVGYDPAHGTFKRAWTLASKALAEMGQVGPTHLALWPVTGPAGPPPTRVALAGPWPRPLIPHPRDEEPEGSDDWLWEEAA